MGEIAGFKTEMDLNKLLSNQVGDPKSWNGGMVEWRNGGMAEWRNGGMAEWRKMTPNPKARNGGK